MLRSSTRGVGPSYLVAVYDMPSPITLLKACSFLWLEEKLLPGCFPLISMFPWFRCWLSYIFLTSKCKTVPAFSHWPSCLSLYPPLMTSYRLMALNIIYMLITPKFLQLGSLFWNLHLYIDCLFDISTWMSKMHLKRGMSKAWTLSNFATLWPWPFEDLLS